MQKYFNLFLNKKGIFGSFLVKLRTKRMFSKIKGIFRYCNAKRLTDNLAAFVMTQFWRHFLLFLGSGPKNNNTIAETSECEWCSSTLLSMTSLLAYTAAQPTKRIFLPKNLSLLVIFVIGLAFTWSRGNKNRAQF